MKILTIFFSVVFALCSNVVQADALQDARSAYDVGNFAEAIKLYQPLADKGDSLAQHMIGHMHLFGNGVPKNGQEAMKWFRLAADQGNARSQRLVGFMFGEGEGVATNHQESMRWYRMAADQGEAISQWTVGEMYRDGKGVSPNHQEALKWYNLAAGQNFVFAQRDLGIMYLNDQNYQEALKWNRLAADQGDLTAQRNLGLTFAEGYGVPKNIIKSYFWCNLSALNGDKNGVKCRDAAAKNMPPEQITRVRQLASECQKIDFKYCKQTTQEESIKCTQLIEANRENAKDNLLGKPLLSYKRNELIAMKEHILICDSKTKEEADRLQSALLTFGGLIEEFDANALINRAKALKSGTQKVESFSDAILLTNPASLTSLMDRPLLSPDKKYYQGDVLIEAKENTLIRVQGVMLMGAYGDHGTQSYAYLKMPKNSVNFSNDGMRIGGTTTIVGKYVGNINYRTIGGVVKTAPIIECSYYTAAENNNDRLTKIINQGGLK